MRKHIKNSSKRKWVVGGVAFFGAVALLTTGFASWVIGINQREGYQQFGVTVDTVTNETCYIDFKIDADQTVKAGEHDRVSTGKIMRTGNDWSKDDDYDFSITYTYRVVIGAAVATKPNQITITMPTTMPTGSTPETEDVNTWNHPAAGAVAITTDDLNVSDSEEPVPVPGTHTTEGTYIQLSTTERGTIADSVTIDLTTLDNWNTTAGASKAVDFDSGVQTGTLYFTWGSFFNNQSPCNYYNNLNYADIMNATAKVQTEMNAFSGLTDPEITLKAELTNKA